jgi:hypothetical protein
MQKKHTPYLFPHRGKILCCRVKPICIQKFLQPSYVLRKYPNITNLRQEGIIQQRNTHSRIQTRNLQRTRANKQFSLMSRIIDIKDIYFSLKVG